MSTPQSDVDHTNPDRDEYSPFIAKLSRRSALGAFATLGIGVLVACGNDGDDSSATTAASGSANPTSAPSSTSPPTSTPTSTTGSTAASTTQSTATTAPAATTTAGAASADYLEFPEETNGPFPADGSNENGSGEEANVLTDPRVIRSDITANLDGSDAQSGIPMTLTMLIGSANAPLGGAAIYIWHCSRDGHYSVYSGGMNGGDYSDSTWFRGVQIADASGAVAFDTVFPGRYQGRATHIHFEVYEDDSFSNLLLTSQIGFEDDDADAVYATDSSYSDSLRNPTYNADDNVFADGDGSQITDLGDPSSLGAGSGLLATVAIGV